MTKLVNCSVLLLATVLLLSYAYYFHDIAEPLVGEGEQPVDHDKAEVCGGPSGASYEQVQDRGQTLPSGQSRPLRLPGAHVSQQCGAVRRPLRPRHVLSTRPAETRHI